MLYVFHGEDEFSRSEAIAQLRQQMDPVVGDLNTTFFDGRTLSVAELRAACDAMPFMGACRLVIVSNLISPPAPARGAQRERKESPAEESRLRDLAAYLPQLPDSTRLVLSEARTLPDGHRLLRLAAGQGGQVQRFTVPVGPDLEHWIKQRAQLKGASITPQALGLLANYVGSNLRLLDQELEKLATYVGPGGSIGAREVERLVSSVQEANIFHMVDALGSRDGRLALRLLRRLLAEKDAPLYLLTMIVRQFRLLLMAQELKTQGAPESEMCRQMECKPPLLHKLLRQAARFRPAELRAIMGQLLDIDVGIKTGQVEGPLALDLFVARWAGR